jgi:hypothetical protein
MPWDCKVTPVGCACQEGNTICCILNNDGLDAGARVLFSTTTIHGLLGRGLQAYNPRCEGAIKGKRGDMKWLYRRCILSTILISPAM